MNEIWFQCRKCGHYIIVELPDEMSVGHLMQKMRWLSHKDCPNCGEESYENWCLYKALTRKKKGKIK